MNGQPVDYGVVKVSDARSPSRRKRVLKVVFPQALTDNWPEPGDSDHFAYVRVVAIPGQGILLQPYDLPEAGPPDVRIVDILRAVQ
jgi:hypothetical protein